MARYGLEIWRKKPASLVDCPSFFTSGFRKRAHSIGVNVKLTSNETMMANAAVYPKLDMNFPTMPLISATGMKMITRLSVVESTAKPMSRVPWMAASTGLNPFSSAKRKMFSRTTMASSITMPTINTSASMVI